MVGKFDKDKISNGKDFAKVNISLDIDGEEYVVSRKVTKQGKNLCTINGEMVSKKELQEFMLDKIDVHRTKGKSKYIRCRKTKKYAR